MERLMAKTFEEVRPDHLMRYRFAVAWLTKHGLTGSVLDAGCGVGYGSNLLSRVIKDVTAVEASPKAALHYAKYFKSDNVSYINGNLFDLQPGTFTCDAVVCFEFLEHIHEAPQAMTLFSSIADLVICSTPNEEIRPHKAPPVNPYHVRHYTPNEFDALLEDAGFEVIERYNQASGNDPLLRHGHNGKFMISVGRRKKS